MVCGRAARASESAPLAVEPHDGLPAGAGGHSGGGIPDGPHACPKGLRHGFGVQAVSRGIALNMVQKWLGHAQLTTTAIYANAVGEEEQSIAARMW
jgi:integrase